MKRLDRLFGTTAAALQRMASDVATKPAVKVPPTATLAVALGMLKDHKAGALAVGTDTTLLGLLTERDVLLKTGLGHEAFATILSQPIAGMMTPIADLSCATPQMSLKDGLRTMLAGKFRHMPVLTSAGSLDSMLSLRQICKALLESGDLASTGATVGDALYYTDQRMANRRDGRAHSIAEVSHTGVVADAVLQMRRRRTGSVLVPMRERTIEGGCVAYGIFTERDYAQRALTATGVDDARIAPLADFLTAPSALVTVDSDLPAADALDLLSREGIRHLPVHKKPQDSEPELLGVLSMRALLAYSFPSAS